MRDADAQSSRLRRSKPSHAYGRRASQLYLRLTSPRCRGGSNSAGGRTFTHDEVKLYYDVYGTGELLLLIHGNGGSISDRAILPDAVREEDRIGDTMKSLEQPGSR